MEKLIVYTVHVTYEDYSYGLDDIFPTRESAIRRAQKRLSLSYITEVQVDKNVVTESLQKYTACAGRKQNTLKPNKH